MIKMNRAERFIVAFNKIEKYFDREIDDTRYVPFFRAVLRLKKTNAIVNKYHNDLMEYSELRNAIVHERTEMNYTIADPHIEVVESIEKIAEELTAPKLVIPIFQRELKVIQEDLSIKDLLALVRETNYTQFPVYKGEKFRGLITDKRIFEWLVHELNGDFEVVLKTPVSELIAGRQGEIYYRFIPRSMNIYEAEEIFLETFKKHDGVDALLITENGKPHEVLLGIMTPRDLIDIP